MESIPMFMSILSFYIALSSLDQGGASLPPAPPIPPAPSTPAMPPAPPTPTTTPAPVAPPMPPTPVAPPIPPAPATPVIPPAPPTPAMPPAPPTPAMPPAPPKVFQRYKVAPWNDTLDYNDTLVASGVTLMECAVACTEERLCNSVFYGDKDKSCFHRTNIYTEIPSRSVYAEGYNYYYLVNTSYIPESPQPPTPGSNTTIPENATCEVPSDSYDVTYVPELGHCLFVHTYFIFNWDLAVLNCYQEKGTLLEIETKDKHNAVKGFLDNDTSTEHIKVNGKPVLEALIQRYSLHGIPTPDAFSSNQGYWLAATSGPYDVNYTWLSSTLPVESDLWADGEPSQPGACVAMENSSPYQLITELCSKLFTIVCEIGTK